MMLPTTPANDKQSPPAPPRTCVPRPSRPRALTPAPKDGASPPKRNFEQQAVAPPPAPRRPAKPSQARCGPLPSKPAPPPLPSKPAPPPLPRPVQLADADLVDDEDTTRAPRAPQPTSEDVELDCFTLSEPPPESRPRRKRGLLACITGLVLVGATGLLLLARPFASHSDQPVDHAVSGAPTVVAARSTPVSASAAQNATNSNPASAGTAQRPKLSSSHSKSNQTTVANLKKPLKRAAPKRALPAKH